MAISRSDNAVLAKVHCLYGKRLSEDDYNNLLQKHSVGEIAGYLKEKTYYASALSEVKEELIHREQFETLLVRSALDAYLRLSKYYHEDKVLLRIYIMQNEAEQLIAAARLLNAGEMNRFISAFPAYLSKHMSFDLFRLAASKTYDDLLNAVEHTGYYQVLGKYRPISADARVDITAFETGLLTYYYEKILSIVREAYSGRARESLEKMIYLSVDIHNFGIVYRMKRYFNKSRPSIAAVLLPVKSLLTRRAYDEILNSPDYIAATETFTRQQAYRKFPFAGSTDADQVVTQMLLIKSHITRTQFRFSTEPAVAVYAYMTMLDIEINNIVNIIEGVRYNLPQDEIRNLLVIF